MQRLLSEAKVILAGVRPRNLVGKTPRRLAVDLLAELVAVDTKMTAVSKELNAMVVARGSLMDLTGVGPRGGGKRPGRRR